MNYNERFKELRSKYSTIGLETIFCDHSDIIIRNSQFRSAYSSSGYTMEESFFFNQSLLGSVNNEFNYPVVMPANKKNPDIIILLHGLNERTWDKYLPWAHALAERTGKAIILFPIAFHMNRSPQNWIDRQVMNTYVTDRAMRMPDVKDLSFINVALSERLTTAPERFFLSGFQAANDIIQLVDDIRQGRSEQFNTNASIDFFAYSIGVLLSEVLLVGDEDDRFSNSRFFFFCGGSAFEGMHGISKYILDSKAFTRIFDYYLQVDNDLKKSGGVVELLNNTSLGNAFKFLVSFSQFKTLPSNLLKRLKEQVKTITLKNDKVIPSESIKETLKGGDIEEYDFEFPYTHENPFPILNKSIAELVDKAFFMIMNKASLYLR